MCTFEGSSFGDVSGKKGDGVGDPPIALRLRDEAQRSTTLGRAHSKRGVGDEGSPLVGTQVHPLPQDRHAIERSHLNRGGALRLKI